MNSDKMIEASDAIIDLLGEKIGDMEQLENMVASIALLEVVKHSIITAAMQ
jgi:hypothetical protein